MTHGDDTGLMLPPKIAPIQVHLWEFLERLHFCLYPKRICCCDSISLAKMVLLYTLLVTRFEVS